MNWIPILFSRKMKIETLSPTLVTKHIPINCNRVCSDLVITPWVENVLTIAVECKVKDKLLPPVQEKVTHSSGFWFWEWLLASIRFLASITTCTISTPVVPEVSVKINSSTFLIKKYYLVCNAQYVQYNSRNTFKLSQFFKIKFKEKLP